MSEGGKKDPMSAGKGDTPRPIDLNKFRDNYDSIDWGRKTERTKALDRIAKLAQKAGLY